MKIAMLGDIALFGRYCKNKNSNIEQQLKVVREYLSGHDVIVGNLETPFADKEKPAGSKSAHVKSHPSNIELLKYLGVTHVTLANNHIGDFGVEAYKQTIRLLDEAGISWFGTEGMQIRIESDGEKIALLGYCSYNTNPSRIWLNSHQALNLLEVDEVVEAMRESTESGYLPILAVHSGQEHVHTPSSHDVAFARGLAEQFDYIYYGHHPHVVQGAELVRNSPIFYSLGNFIFDDVYTPRDLSKPLITLSEANKTGIIASVEIKEGNIINWMCVPTYLAEKEMLVGDQVFDFNMSPYSNALKKAGSKDYDVERTNKINEYIDSRRNMRNFKWYIKRLNFNSLGIMFAARRNAKNYRIKFVNQLSRLGAKQ
ncbi:CapA family protein [Pseudidiomarina sp. 1ASP75-14]|uniref:CapA family protein n=1 Tax=Pseudidiomarina terrestris TaxID=2820060 RepID=UPI002652618B|nr:CapA family protein [Pseudidiomarina sp. 1ASP75-14]MDN7136781.1 CapA family protein [Pseudidiomarina sp. 1ASP75-14]